MHRLLRCLGQIGPDDRFNVILFRENPIRGFEGWAQGTPENVAAARDVGDLGELRDEGHLMRQRASGTYLPGRSAASASRVVLLFHPRAKRPGSLPCTGSGVGHGHPPNWVTR